MLCVTHEMLPIPDAGDTRTPVSHVERSAVSFRVVWLLWAHKRRLCMYVELSRFQRCVCRVYDMIDKSEDGAFVGGGP